MLTSFIEEVVLWLHETIEEPALLWLQLERFLIFFIPECQPFKWLLVSTGKIYIGHLSNNHNTHMLMSLPHYMNLAISVPVILHWWEFISWKIDFVGVDLTNMNLYNQGEHRPSSGVLIKVKNKSWGVP